MVVRQHAIASVALVALAPAVRAQLQFAEFTPLASNTSTVDVALGDVDGDGDLDMALAKGSRPSQLYLNDGNGVFADVTAVRMPTQNGYTSALQLGDVDGDGDLDMALGKNGQNLLYLNDGTGTFADVTAHLMPVDSDNTADLLLGDVDGDGDLDMFVANGVRYSRTPDRLYVNNGSGTFVNVTVSRLPLTTGTTSVALGDMDGDGDVDLVGGRDGNSWMYFNDGAGTFTNPGGRLLGHRDNTTDVKLGDVDGDGDLDIVMANDVWQMFWPTLQRLYLNDGAGFFTERFLPGPLIFADEVAMGDLDGDGDLDLSWANHGTFYSTPHNRLQINDGTGTFEDVTYERTPIVLDESRAVALGDVDGDGDLDVVVGNEAEDRLSVNLLRQLDTPNESALGQTYRLDIYARYGPQRQQDIGYPLLSAGTASIPLPWGTLGLDPSSIVGLPPIVLNPDTGLGSVSLPIPNVPALVGATLYSQALLVQQPVQARFTNVAADTFR